MMTVNELIKELRKFRSDLPVNLVVRNPQQQADFVDSDDTVTCHGSVVIVAAHSIAPGTIHVASQDGIGVFITNTPEY